MTSDAQRRLETYVARAPAPRLRVVAGGRAGAAGDRERPDEETGLILAALRIAFAEADEARETILERLRTRDVLALGLALASAVSSGGVIVALGLPEDGAVLARAAALVAIATAMGPVVVDHLSLKPKEGWGLIDRIGAIKGRVRTLEFRMPCADAPEGGPSPLLQEAVALIEELTDIEARLETLGLRG